MNKKSNQCQTVAVPGFIHQPETGQYVWIAKNIAKQFYLNNYMSNKQNDTIDEDEQERLDDIQENTDSLEEKLEQINE